MVQYRKSIHGEVGSSSRAATTIVPIMRWIAAFTDLSNYVRVTCILRSFIRALQYLLPSFLLWSYSSFGYGTRRLDLNKTEDFLCHCISTSSTSFGYHSDAASICLHVLPKILICLTVDETAFQLPSRIEHFLLT